MNKLVFIENGFVYIKDEMDISGNTFEQEYTAYVTTREDLETPHQCDAEILAPDAGAPLDQLEAYADEFHRMVEDMFEKLPEETRLLEGTQIPTYDDLRKETENELSETKDNDSNGQCVGDMAS